MESGPANVRMDYVFIGDGYTAAQIGKWRTDAKKVIDGFLADPLFAANRASINVRRVDVASNQSGVDEPDQGVFRDTAMDGNFNCFNIDRLLCVDEGKVREFVGSVLPLISATSSLSFPTRRAMAAPAVGSPPCR